MPLSSEQRDDIMEHIREKVAEAGQELTPESFVATLFDEWDAVTDPVQMDRKAKRAEIQRLRDQKQANRDSNDALDVRIAELQVELGNGG